MEVSVTSVEKRGALPNGMAEHQTQDGQKEMLIVTAHC